MARAVAATIGGPASPAVAAGGLSAPRRERKKQQTRDALVRAGLELFRSQGYEHTAVHEITDAVDVAERTFFRYFASKEDLALSFVKDGAQAFAEALRGRPAGEEPLQALRNAFHLTLQQLRAGDSTAGESTYLSMMELIDSTPALLATQLRYIHSDDTTVRVLAERENVDPDTDLRPRVLATVFAALVFRATRAWRISGGDGAGSLAASFDQYADQLGPALAGHWNTPDGDDASPGSAAPAR
jgi:AcrR family transcriptional regulator